MVLKAKDIRTLRQRLGWSLAEMARQMGCSTELIIDWEQGLSQPDQDAVNQLLYLNVHIETYSEQLSQVPVAEKEMESRQLGQLTHRDLLKDSI